jgi:quercetin dioxygenase-like cupin family protein
VTRAPTRIRDEPPPRWTKLAGGAFVRRMVEGNGSSIDLYRIEPAHRFEPHEHSFAELGVILKGQGRLQIGEGEREVREGDAYYVPGGAAHGFIVTGTDPVVMLNVCVPPAEDLTGSATSEVLRLARLTVKPTVGPP